jgi:hypothetical protein
MADSTALQFRATVAFMLDGVPHHTVGEWRQSKHIAKRDAAERALVLFIGCWGEQSLEQPSQVSEEQLDEQQQVNTSDNIVREVKILQDFCRSFPCPQPAWHVSWEGNRCQAFVEISLMDVPHQFVGAAWDNEQAAYIDTARRVLWYLNCPGFDDSFEPDPDAPVALAKDIPAPPSNWMSCDPVEEGAAQLVERKTAIVRVQNRLQQAFAKQLKPGQSVWEWSYENDFSSPHLYRATVRIPVAGMEYTGSWMQSQRDAQVDTCGLVSDFLDKRENAQRGKPDRQTAAGWQRTRR